MHRLRTLTVVCAIVGLLAVPLGAGQEFKNGQAPPQAEFTPEEQELVQLERTWDAAFVAKDIRFIERVLADEFVATYGDGTRGDKAAEMAQTLDFDQRVDSSVLDSFRVRIYGETRPCEQMERAAPGLQAAMTVPFGGGAFGEILDDGEIAVGDPVSLS